jgi:putative alpha-1,2-mannosidase
LRGIAFEPLLILFVILSALSCKAQEPVSEVDPFIGTSINVIQDFGNTLPGAVRPLGMLY